jgi:hypothetical protein
MARRRNRPLVPESGEALDALKEALKKRVAPRDAEPESMVARFRRLAHELVERERLR